MATEITLNTDGMLLNWLKSVGDSVKSGDIIAEVEADKATMEVEAPQDGVLVEIRAEVGEEVSEGTVIGIIGAAGETPADTGQEQEQPEPEQDGSAQQEPVSAPSGSNGAARTETGRIKASPVARNIADERGIDLSQVSGTGPGGRIVKRDVLSFKPGEQPAPAPTTKEAQTPSSPTAPPSKVGGTPTYGALPQGDHVEIEDISRMRRTIADNTVISMQMTPHFYVTVDDIDVEPLLALRKQLNAELESEGIKISVNDMVVKAVALTLRKFPNLNTHYYGDKLVHHKNINVGIAVALPNNGLINVVAKDADKTALSVLAQENKAMFARAREGRIKPDDIKGATFTVSNLGPYNVSHFAAIISPPEAGILAVSSAKKVPVVLEDGTVGVGTRMAVTLSVDHRISDGAEGAEFLQEFKALIENPIRLLV